MNNDRSYLEEAYFSQDMVGFEPLMEQFQTSIYFPLWRQAMGSLKWELLHRSRLHGRGHIERTMLFGALLAMKESLSQTDAVLLLLGCSYHDVGRVSDRMDDFHGQRSAERMAEITGLPEGEDLNILRTMAEIHSIDDTKLDEVCDKYGVQDRVRAKKLAFLLKDADALDRVRISHMLDIRYFRFASSKTLLPFAFRIYGADQTLVHQRDDETTVM
jgi:HD superfamily phosphodiesterase